MTRIREGHSLDVRVEVGVTGGVVGIGVGVATLREADTDDTGFQTGLTTLLRGVVLGGLCLSRLFVTGET